MITDSQIKEFLDSMWEEYFDHISDNEFSTYADKSTCMMFEFEDYIHTMSFGDMFNSICERTPENYDTDNFDEYDYKLIKAACSDGTDIMLHLFNKPFDMKEHLYD
jgi:hypothetical protein